MSGPEVQAFVAGLYRVVFELLLPPLIRIFPSGSSEVPGQNMSCPVLATRAWVTLPVVRFRMDVSVLPLVPPRAMGEFEDQVSSRLPGNRAAATGTSGKLIVGPHDPSDTGRGD